MEAKPSAATLLLYFLVWMPLALAVEQFDMHADRDDTISFAGRHKAFMSMCEDIPPWDIKPRDESTQTRRKSVPETSEPESVKPVKMMAAQSEMCADLPRTLIDKLWRENDDLVQDFLNVTFLNFQATHHDDEALPSYQYYSVQDYYYLVDFVEYKALWMTTYPRTNATKLLLQLTDSVKSVNNSVRDSWSFRSDLKSKLNVSFGVIDNGGRSVEEIAYASWLQNNLYYGWYTLRVMTIPCVYGWYKLADRLNSSDATLTNTIFYDTWVKPNLDPSYGQRLSDFLEKYRDEYTSPESVRTWTAVFRQALKFEIAFFNSALDKSITSL